MNLKRMSVEDRFRAVRALEGFDVSLVFTSGGQRLICEHAHVIGAAQPWLDGNSTGVLVYRRRRDHGLGVVSLARVEKIERLRGEATDNPNNHAADRRDASSRP